MRIDRAMGTSQEILRSNLRVVFRVSFLEELVSSTRATLCFKASMRLITCGPSVAGAATISLPATLASINCCSFREYRSGYLSRVKSPVEALIQGLGHLQLLRSHLGLGSLMRQGGWLSHLVPVVEHLQDQQ